MSDYTPTTEEIRTGYAAVGDAILLGHEAEFDRWLAAHDAEVREDEGARIAEEIAALHHGGRYSKHMGHCEARSYCEGLTDAENIAGEYRGESAE